jgi:hypothetical protein
MATCYLLFHTIHDVLKAEKALKRMGVALELIPVPRNLSSDCGSCIRLNVSTDIAADYLKDFGADRCYVYDGTTYNLVAQGA